MEWREEGVGKGREGGIRRWEGSERWRFGVVVFDFLFIVRL